MTTPDYNTDRNKVAEFKREAIIAEVYEKKSKNDSNKIFFDVRFVREFVVDGERKRGPFVQQRDLRDIIIVAVEAQKFIAERHHEIRNKRRHEEDGYEVDDTSIEDGDE